MATNNTSSCKEKKKKISFFEKESPTNYLFNPKIKFFVNPIKCGREKAIRTVLTNFLTHFVNVAFVVTIEQFLNCILKKAILSLNVITKSNNLYP